MPPKNDPKKSRTQEETRSAAKDKIAYLKEQREKQEALKQLEAQREQKDLEQQAALKGDLGFWKQFKAAKEVVEKRVSAKPDDEINKDLDQLIKAKRIHLEDIEGGFLKGGIYTSDIKKSPPSVIAVYKLVKALNSFEGEIGHVTNEAKTQMAENLKNMLFAYAHSKDEDKLEKFEAGCSAVMKAGYKFLAAESSLWNWIKEKIKPVLEKLHINTEGLLDSSKVIKNASVQAGFKEALQAQIKIEDEPNIDTRLQPK